MGKLNCWEYHKCGREPGGINANDGICPASTFEEANGFLGGKNGGRACAYVTGTFCSQTLKGTKRKHCMPCKQCIDCGFYYILRRESNDKMSLHNFLIYVTGSGV